MSALEYKRQSPYMPGSFLEVPAVGCGTDLSFSRRICIIYSSSSAMRLVAYFVFMHGRNELAALLLAIATEDNSRTHI